MVYTTLPTLNITKICVECRLQSYSKSSKNSPFFNFPPLEATDSSVSNQSKTFDQQFQKGFPLHKIAFPLQIFLVPNSKKIQRPTYQVPFSRTITLNLGDDHFYTYRRNGSLTVCCTTLRQGKIVA